MTRLDRARLIRDAVLGAANEHGRYVDRGCYRVLEVYGSGWFARYHSPFNPAPGYRHGLYSAPPTSTRAFAYGVSVWLQPGPKVLKLVWQQDVERIVSMRRGEWEEELFGLPPYRGTAGLKSWELRRRRARRW